MTPELAPSLSLLVKQQPLWTVVRALGELGWESRAQFDDCLSTVIHQDGQACICLDLSGLEFCDSSGIACIMRAWRAVSQRGGQMVLKAPQANLARKLIFLGLADLLPVVDKLP